jgi:hypothetical protein
MRSLRNSVSTELRLARQIWGSLEPPKFAQLRQLIRTHGLSVALGDVCCIDGGWHVTSAGLLRLAQRRRCVSIRTRLETQLCDPAAKRWVFRALVRTPLGKAFTGYGDADPSNVSPLVRGAEMRVAETRAVNRALRKAYGIGICSVEELGYLSSRTDSPSGDSNRCAHLRGENSANGHSRLRDRLCLLIRQQQLDPALVKRYAADFCGAQELRQATRQSIESFIAHVAEWAQKDRDGLVCKLNSYAPAQRVQP